MVLLVLAAATTLLLEIIASAGDGPGVGCCRHFPPHLCLGGQLCLTTTIGIVAVFAVFVVVDSFFFLLLSLQPRWIAPNERRVDETEVEVRYRAVLGEE